MKKMFPVFIAALLLLPVSCKSKEDPNKSVDEGKIVKNYYTSEEIGWKIEIPNGWEIMSRDQIQSEQTRGEEALEETVGQEIDFSQLKSLIHFQKNPFNSLESSSEPFELEYEGEYRDNCGQVKDLIYQTFVNQGIASDSTAIGVETINGLDFFTFDFTIYDKKGNVIMYSRSYNRLINGYDFCVSVYYNNDKDKAELMRVWKQSVFQRK